MCNCNQKRNIPYTQKVVTNNSKNLQLKNIWYRIIKYDEQAKNELIRIYIEKYPNNKRLTIDKSINNLHKLFIQLINS